MESRKRIKLDKKVVLDKFSCTVCLKLPKAHIFQCGNGHILCKECYENPRLKNKCPGCRGKLPPPSQRIRNLVVQNFLDKIIKVECSFKKNGCEYEGDRDQAESHRATCFYNFEKYGQLVNLCQKLGYTSCNYQLNNGKATAAIDHFQTEHGFHLAQSQTFEMILEHFKRAITLRSSPHFWTPIIAKLAEGQGHALLVPIINNNEDFACLSVCFPDPDYYNPSVPQPTIQVKFELRETKNSEFCKISFVQDTISIPKVMEISLENLSRPIRGTVLMEHMRNEERMMMSCKIKGNGSFTRESVADLEPFLCKLNPPLQEPGTGKIDKALKWLEEAEVNAKVDRDSLWEFLFCLFDKQKKPDGYCHQEIAFVKEKAFHLVLRQGTAAQLNFLKRKGLNMGNNYKYGTPGCTTLQYVLKADKDKKIALEKVKILVNSGVDFKELNNFGSSVLHYASAHGGMQTVKYCLEELRLDANAANCIGATPLHFAVRRTEGCAMAIAQLLLDHGADPQMKTKKGNDVLEVAKRNYKEKLQEIFRLHQAKKSRK